MSIRRGIKCKVFTGIKMIKLSPERGKNEKEVCILTLTNSRKRTDKNCQERRTLNFTLLLVIVNPCINVHPSP